MAETTVTTTAAVLKPEVRNPVATATGTSIAVLLAWIYNDVLAAHYGLVVMPESVVIVVAGLIVDAARYFMTARAVVVPATSETVVVNPPVVVAPPVEEPRDPQFR